VQFYTIQTQHSNQCLCDQKFGQIEHYSPNLPMFYYQSYISTTPVSSTSLCKIVKRLFYLSILSARVHVLLEYVTLTLQIKENQSYITLTTGQYLDTGVSVLLVNFA